MGTVFQRIVEQVAQHLGDGFAVDVGRDVLVGMAYGECLAVVGEGGLEAFEGGGEQLVDVHILEHGFQMVGTHLAEVEQLRG